MPYVAWVTLNDSCRLPKSTCSGAWKNHAQLTAGQRTPEGSRHDLPIVAAAAAGTAQKAKNKVCTRRRKDKNVAPECLTTATVAEA